MTVAQSIRPVFHAHRSMWTNSHTGPAARRATGVGKSSLEYAEDLIDCSPSLSAEPLLPGFFIESLDTVDCH